MSNITIKRIYETPESSDGIRILVDRLWPRGVRKVDAQLTLWMKEVAPSPGLRIWFQHLSERFESFKEQYMAELSNDAATPYLEKIKQMEKSETVTLLYAAKDKHINHAICLKQFLDEMK